MNGDQMRDALETIRRDIADATYPCQRHPADARLADALDKLGYVLRQVVDQLYPEPFGPPAPPPAEEGFVELEYDEPITDFAAVVQLTAAGRGRIICGFYPFEDGSDALGKLIRVQGKIWRIRGVERFAIGRAVQNGDSVGFLVGQA